jgi:hypothetical protein
LREHLLAHFSPSPRGHPDDTGRPPFRNNAIPAIKPSLKALDATANPSASGLPLLI